MARPKSSEGKKTKTYSFFESDIDYMLDCGSSAAEIFRLGVLAKQNNPQIVDRTRESEEKIQKLALRLDSFAKKYYNVKQLLEKFMGQSIEELSKVE